ncbi:phosphatidylglycerophosphatase B [Legionella nautarum]|uniref:Phosphatidylglycerophosphatase B n=1 Tax=Legionella nautarum TaxID=45070 RepID=A0A0W0X487_9GAMM|nr:phosphatase PAP2 family protein [Legionella nautarum]KTD39338.1 phosphatidylglycerophosphatase B [Legionella nautarum]
MSPFDRLFSTMTKPLAIILFLALIIYLFLNFDKPLTYYFYALDLRHQIPILSFLTRLGLGVIYIPTFFALALIFRFIVVNPRWEARAWFLFLCVTIPGLICFFLKIVLGRTRPSMLLYNQLYGFYGLKWNAHYWSIPSGHTTTIMGLILGLGILFPRYFLAFILLGITVALSRVFLSHHFLSDVLFAAYLALVEVGVLLSILRRKSWLTPVWRHTI